MKIKLNDPQDPFNGIFNFMFSKLSEKKVKEIVHVSASSTLNTRGDPFTTIDPNANETKYTDCWVSNPARNSNLTISFQNHQFAMDSYTLQSRKGLSVNVPVEWVIEGTNNFLNWETVHSKERDNEIVGDGKIYNWNVSSKKFFHTYRMTMIDENYYGSESQRYYFGLGRIEFFGSLFEVNCKQLQCNSHNLLPLIFLCLCI